MARRAFLAALILLFGGLTACSEPPPLKPLAPGAVILAFGDSLTAGVGASRGEDYPSVLAELSGFEVVNRGISGETAAKGRKRLPGVLDEVEPDLLLLLEGGNDILRNQPNAKIKAYLAEMIEEAQGRGITVVLLGVPEKNLLSSAAPFYAELAAEYQLVADPELVGGLLRRPGYKSDPIHFNADGYEALADGIRDLLSDAGALP